MSGNTEQYAMTGDWKRRRLGQVPRVDGPLPDDPPGFPRADEAGETLDSVGSTPMSDFRRAIDAIEKHAEKRRIGFSPASPGETPGLIIPMGKVVLRAAADANGSVGSPLAQEVAGWVERGEVSQVFHDHIRREVTFTHPRERRITLAEKEAERVVDFRSFPLHQQIEKRRIGVPPTPPGGETQSLFPALGSLQHLVQREPGVRFSVIRDGAQKVICWCDGCGTANHRPWPAVFSIEDPAGELRDMVKRLVHGIWCTARRGGTNGRVPAPPWLRVMWHYYTVDLCCAACDGRLVASRDEVRSLMDADGAFPLLMGASLANLITRVPHGENCR